MGRIRTIKPELIEMARFAALSDGAARMFYGLMSCADDHGRCPAALGYIAGQIFWAKTRPATLLGRFLTELEAAGWVERYSSQGGEWLSIVGWSDKGSPTYQHINKRQDPQFPPPEPTGDGTADGPTNGLRDRPDPIRSDPKRSDPIRSAPVLETVSNQEREPERDPDPQARCRPGDAARAHQLVSNLALAIRGKP